MRGHKIKCSGMFSNPDYLAIPKLTIRPSLCDYFYEYLVACFQTFLRQQDKRTLVESYLFIHKSINEYVWAEAKSK